jgi:hypothetical protein
LQLSKKHVKTYILPCNLSTSTRFAILHKKNCQAVIHRISDHRFFSYAFLFSIFYTLPVQSTCWYFKQSIINSQIIRISNEFGHKSLGFDMVEVVHNYPCSHLPHLTLLIVIKEMQAWCSINRLIIFLPQPARWTVSFDSTHQRRPLGRIIHNSG